MLGERRIPESDPNPRAGSLWPGRLTLITGLVLLGLGVSYGYNQFSATHQVAAPVPVPQQLVTGDATAPAETKPAASAVQQYTVPADQPRSLSIKSAGISGLIQRVGITPDHAMAVPTNVYFAGWYTESVRPGQPGLSIINGHVSGNYTNGIFKQLGKVKPGAVISIERGDGSIVHYTVVDTVTVPSTQAISYLFTKRANITSQLDLITCGGKFNTTTQRFDDRVIVVAQRSDGG